MRISELARRTGVSVPTIKYYLRLGLLPAGKPMAPNQASYGDAHVRRLRLIQVLLDIGGFSVKSTQKLLATIDSGNEWSEALLAPTDSARAKSPWRVPSSELGAMARHVAERLAALGWRVRPDGHSLDRLANICLAAQLLGMRELVAAVEAYAEAAARLAECDAAVSSVLLSRAGAEAGLRHEARAEAVLAAVVLGEAMTVCLHRLASAETLARLLAERAPVGEATPTAQPARPDPALAAAPPQAAPVNPAGAR